MTIQRTYHDEERTDRDVGADLWSWLKDQSQDVWLLWVREVNWDLSDELVSAMVANPDLDRAFVSYLFFGGGASVRDGEVKIGPLTRQIAENVEKGFYARAELYLDPALLVRGAQDYIEVMEQGYKLPFAFPRALCGPFGSRRARCPNWDPQTKADLAEIFAELDGGIPPSEDAFMRSLWARGNLWHVEAADLSGYGNFDDPNLARMDDLALLQKLFGNGRAYRRKRERVRKRRYRKVDILGQPTLAYRLRKIFA